MSIPTPDTAVFANERIRNAIKLALALPPLFDVRFVEFSPVILEAPK